MGEQLSIDTGSSRIEVGRIGKSPRGSGAVLSPCERYRYRLWRGDEPGRQAIFIMCNPSTADAAADDPTIRKCVGFAERWGCTGIEVVNVCAFRSRHPRDLLTIDDPVGPDNFEHIDSAFGECRRWGEPLVVVAWGSALPKPLREHALATLGWLDLLGAVPQCLGTTKGDGQPRHPLMLAYATPLERYRG